jgi:two-component system sensor histidine kinase RegB
MRQLVQLRWLAVVGQLIAILVAHYGFHVRLPIAPMLAIVALLALANLLFAVTLRRLWFVRGEILLALLLDMAALTAQLYLSGGATNPFVSLFLLQVVLGAILLRPSSVWLLIGISLMAYAFLSVAHLPLSIPAPSWGLATDLVLTAEWISFAMVAILLVLFITRISRNLRARDAYVAQLGQRAAEEGGIVRMGLFASGAAHELGTPLSTLSVLIADWMKNPALDGDPAFRDELAEAQAEVQRCKEIVSDILHSAGSDRGEAMASERAAELLSGIAEDWQALHPAVALAYEPVRLDGARVAAEPALRQALFNLLDNAAEVSPIGVKLRAEIEGEQLAITVLDWGPGLPAEQLKELGRLYQSRKGAGHGVGLFLAANVARRLGGALEASNRVDGASVRLLLPLTGKGEEGGG